MSPALKFVIGLAAVAGMGGVHHGLMGNGEALVNRIESEARTAVAATQVPGINVRLGRNPLTRMATLSGNADEFQREGQGELKGINDRVRDVPGLSGVRWSDENSSALVMPLFLELLLQLIAAYLIGLGLAKLLWGRRKREGFY